MEGVAMLAPKSWAAAIASALFLASTASAQYAPVSGPYNAPVTQMPFGYAPDAPARGFYFYCNNAQIGGNNGQIGGNNGQIGGGYCDMGLPPAPYSGVGPFEMPLEGRRRLLGCLRGGAGGSAGATARPEPQYPTHPWAPGPRDFFMFRENMEEQLSRQTRPSVLP